MATDWTQVPMCFIPAPPRGRCPKCFSKDHLIVRTMPVESDGSYARRCICKDCSARFLIILQPPANDWQEVCDALIHSELP